MGMTQHSPRSFRGLREDRAFAASKISQRRRQKSAGNALLEWMLVLLPTMALITGFFDVSYALFSWSTIQNAVREGCRYAITFQLQTGLNQDASIKAIVATNSMGLVSAGGGLIYVNYFTQAAPNTAIAAPNGNDPGNIVEVSIQGYPLNWMIPISGTVVNPVRGSSPATVSVYSSDILGGYPAGVSSIPR
jgi:Flp pilus assembly protein TadG